MDDVAGLTDAAGWVRVQAKKKLPRSGDRTSDLARAFEQLIAIEALEVPGRRARMTCDPFPRSRPVLILTNDEAASTVAEAMDRLRTLPEAVPLTGAAATAGGRDSLKTLCGHLKRVYG